MLITKNKRQSKSVIQDIEAVTWTGLITHLGFDINNPASGLSAERVERLVALKREIEMRYKQFKVLYYKPQEYQRGFFLSKVKVHAAFGGNQSGKTTTAFCKAAMISLGIHPTVSQARGGWIPTPNRGRILCTDFSKGLAEDIETKIDEWFPSSEIAHIKRNQAGHLTKLTLVNRSTIDFLTYEQYSNEPQIAEGWSGHYVFANEPLPEGMFKACMRGLVRHAGLFFIAATPLEEPWMYDSIYLKADGVNTAWWEFDTTNNTFLSPAELDDFKSRLTPEEFETRIRGKFKSLSGLVYKELNPQLHVVEPFDIPADWPVYAAFDYHPRKPMPGVWAACDPRGRLYVFAEMEEQGTIADIAEVIKRIERNKRVVSRHIDPLSATPERVSGSCAMREFGRMNVHMRSANKDVHRGMNAVRQRLKLGNDGSPGIMFFKGRTDKCVYSLQRFQWANIDTVSSEKVADEFKDFPDCVRYLCAMNPRWVDQTLRNLKESLDNHAENVYNPVGRYVPVSGA